MRKSIILALIAIAGLVFSSYASAAEVLWQSTDETDITVVANDVSGTASSNSGWFPLVKTVFSDERGGDMRSFTPDFFRFNIRMAPTALAGTADDSVNVNISLETSEDKTHLSQARIALHSFREAQASSEEKEYEVFFPSTYFTETTPLLTWGRLVFTTMATSTDGAEGDSITVSRIVFRALTRP